MECKAAVDSIAKAAGKIPRKLKVGTGGKCMDGSWGQVPMGCSAKFGRVPYYKTGTEPPGYGPGCTLSDYQPVCVSHPGMFNIRFYFIFLRMKSIRFTLLLDE